MLVIRKRPQAATDLIEYAEFLAEENIDLALRFLDAAESTFIFVAHNPEMGALCKFSTQEAAQVRFWPIKGFEKCLLFYQPILSGIEIVRIIHGARDLAAILSE